jgi:nucleotide-binding universal stress UspA family protein
MPIRHILVPLTGSCDETHAITSAMCIATRFKAHVAVCNTVPYRAPPIDLAGSGVAPTFDPELASILQSLQDKARAQARASFDRAVAQEKTAVASAPDCAASSTWYEPGDDRDVVLSEAAQLTDLIVAPRPQGTGFVGQIENIEQALFASSRAVLVVPYAIRDVGSSIAVAWNGSPEAASAVRQTAALLPVGAKITILQAGDLARGGLPAEAAAAYLKWHGYTVAAIKRVEDRPRATAHILLAEAKAAAASVLVLGAYSHSRFREMVLGGVTASLLKDSDLPLLMAHR